MSTTVSTCLVDHHPSVVKNVFPKEVLESIQPYYDVLNAEEVKKILGEEENEQFRVSLRGNVFPQGCLSDEFHMPVASLYHYKKLEGTLSEKNRSALRVHGASHGTMDASLHPENRHLWARIIEIVDDLIFLEDVGECAKSIRNNQVLLTSLLPVEEIKATYLKDLSLADQERRSQLLKFEYIQISELQEVEQKLHWSYVAACKSYNLLQKNLFNTREIEDLIKICNSKSLICAIRQTENWIKGEDIYLSNLPHFINILGNAEKIAGENPKDKWKAIEDIMRKPPKVKCINLASSIRIPKLEEATVEKFKKSVDLWRTWKLISLLGALQEGEIAEAALYDLSDYIVASAIVTSGTPNQWTYEVLIPKPKNNKEQILKIIMRLRSLLLKVNPALNYKPDLKRGDKIKVFDKEIILPKIVPQINKIKKTLETEEDNRKDIQKELEEYAKTSKLEQRIETALNQTPTISNIQQPLYR
ncbi:MAG: hypothetical protein KIH08_13080 [Candidatus Freyarchaeota archaeon]|nr:hypothetical protein [Candidatus Jordarchaeia archaeon]MBS7269316.1 hypothetical protein [Candidatus Jordarchaeia archaeon]MBS7281107.1 hypothetical protein [Candidatus Jordarchaeia archaeon]